MRKLLLLSLVLLLTSCTEFITGDDAIAPQTVTLPLGDCFYIDVDVPSTAQLQQTNEESFYKFDTISVSRLSGSVEGDTLTKGICHDGNKSIWIKALNYYIYVDSDKGYLHNAYQSFKENNVYEVKPSYSLGSIKRIEQLPSIEVTDKMQLTKNGLQVPYTNERIDDLAAFYYNEDYLTESVIYQPISALKQDILSRFEIIYKEAPIEYYESDTYFYIKSKTHAVGIRQENLNTSYIYKCKGDYLYPYFLASLRGV